MAKIQTDKQRKLIKLIAENVGLEKPKTMKHMLLEAGYAPSIAEQQTNALVGIREELEPIVGEMIRVREKAIARMHSTLPKANYRDLMDSIDKLTKNIQLLSGGKTANDDLHITWEQ